MQSLLPPKLVAILIVIMVLATLVLPWPNLPWAMRIAGLALLVLGIALNVRHANMFTERGTNIRTFNDPDLLIQQGAFDWTRNPMYLGFVVILIGVAIILGSAIALVGPGAFFIAADRWYIPFEERRMAAIFGPGYDEYKARVRRWVGRKTLV